MPNSFEKPSTCENPHLKEYPKDFGNGAAEEMAAEFIELIPGINSVQRSSKYDDNKNGFDMIVEFENESKLAIDVTSTDDCKRQKEKIKKITGEPGKTPLVQEHDNNGQIINEIKMPLVLFVYKRTEWGKSYNDFLAGKIDNPLKNIDQEENLKKFFTQTIMCLENQTYHYPRFKEIKTALETIEIIEKKMKDKK